MFIWNEVFGVSNQYNTASAVQYHKIYSAEELARSQYNILTISEDQLNYVGPTDRQLAAHEGLRDAWERYVVVAKLHDIPVKRFGE